MREDTDFFTDLRTEIENSKQRRSNYVLSKLGLIVGLFGVGAMKIAGQPSASLLYLTPLVVFVFDLYVIGEDFGIKRAGAFLLRNPKVPNEERRWEKVAKDNRDPVTGIASFISSAFVVLAAAAALLQAQADPNILALWCCASAGVILFSFFYGRLLVTRLKTLNNYLDKEFALSMSTPEVCPPNMLTAKRNHPVNLAPDCQQSLSGNERFFSAKERTVIQNTPDSKRVAHKLRT